MSFRRRRTLPYNQFKYLVDEYPPVAAYSLKRMSSTYVGNCIRVRRSSDNTQQDIGFVQDGLDIPSLLSFVGAGSGYVTIWYDQAGSSYDVTNATTAQQPRIVNGGVLDTVGGIPYISFLGTTNTLNFPAGALSIYQNKTHGAIFGNVASSNVTGSHLYVNFSVGNSGNTRFAAGVINSNYLTIARRLDGTGGATLATPVINFVPLEGVTHTAIVDWGSNSIYGVGNGVTGSTTTISTAGSTSNTASVLGVIGGAASGVVVTKWAGYVREVVLYNTDQSANIAAINKILYYYRLWAW